MNLFQLEELKLPRAFLSILSLCRNSRLNLRSCQHASTIRRNLKFRKALIGKLSGEFQRRGATYDSSVQMFRCPTPQEYYQTCNIIRSS
jgi:hypothetical protein